MLETVCKLIAHLQQVAEKNKACFSATWVNMPLEKTLGVTILSMKKNGEFNFHIDLLECDDIEDKIEQFKLNVESACK